MTVPRGRLFWWALLPLALLVVVSLAVTSGGLLEFLKRGLPPVEELTFDPATLTRNNIRIEIVNGGPDPVTVAQVLVDDAFWDFTIEPDNTIPRLHRATIEIPYPWVKDEPHEIKLLTSTGLTFTHEIEVAALTPTVDAKFLGIFILIGLYVGVIPVAIGLLWYPVLRRLSRPWMDFVLALTIGLLVFLGADAVHEAFESATMVAGAFQGPMLVVIGALGTLFLLQSVSRARIESGGAESRRAVAFLIALGIGLHNFAEGLAIGAAYSLGKAALSAFLIFGFMLHNTTEGLVIVAPIAKDRPRIGTLIALGALAGGPTVVGSLVGGLAYSPLYATLFLAVGAGAIAQVVIALYRVIRGEDTSMVWTPLTASGMVAGLLVMYATGLLVAV